jgi:hypothetical protein
MGRIFDSENLIHLINKIVTRLKNRFPEMTTEIEEAHQEMQQAVDQEVKFVTIGYETRQRFYYHMGGYLALWDERKAWYFYHAIMLCLGDDAFEELVKSRYKSAYPQVKQRLLQYGTIVNHVKYHYDRMEALSVQNKELYMYHDKECRRYLARLPVIFDDLNYIYLLIAKYTTIGQTTVPQQCITVFTQQYKKVTYDEQRRSRGEPMEAPDGGA